MTTKKKENACEVCNGTGSVYKQWSDSETGCGDSGYFDCEDCHGAGLAYNRGFGEKIRFEIITQSPGEFDKFLLVVRCGGVRMTFEVYQPSGERALCLKNPAGDDVKVCGLTDAIDLAGKVIRGRAHFPIGAGGVFFGERKQPDDKYHGRPVL